MPAEPSGRVQTCDLDERYSGHFRLHTRYPSDDDTPAKVQVEVEIMGPPSQGSFGYRSTSQEKRHIFGSLESAYEFMDYQLNHLAQKPAPLPVPITNTFQRRAPHLPLPVLCLCYTRVCWAQKRRHICLRDL